MEATRILRVVKLLHWKVSNSKKATLESMRNLPKGASIHVKIKMQTYRHLSQITLALPHAGQEQIIMCISIWYRLGPKLKQLGYD